MAMRRWGVSGYLFVLSLSLGAVAGCDSASFVPPPPTGLRPEARPAGAGARPSARSVVLVLPAEDNSDIAVWETVARQEAGLQQFGFSVARPAPSDSAGKQAELIRDSAKSASALIVVTDRSPETTAALAAIDPSRTKVVLLGRELPDSPEAKKVKAVLVTTPPPAQSAKPLVAAAVRAAKEVPDAPKGAPTAILVRSLVADETSEVRSKALADAAKAAGLDLVADVAFDGTMEGFGKLLTRLDKEHPRTSVLVCAEEMAISGVVSAQDSQKLVVDPNASAAAPRPEPKGPSVADKYKTVGYVSSKASLNLARLGKCVALSDRNVQGLARGAIQATRELADGKTVPPRVEIEMPVVESK